MKYLYVFFTSLLFLSCKSQIIDNNKTVIDSIENENQIDELILSIGEFKNFKIINISDFRNKDSNETPCRIIGDSLKIEKSFYKADFDLNGFTDILVSGMHYNEFTVLSILGFKNNKYKILKVSKKSFRDCMYYKIKLIDKVPLVEFYYYDENQKTNKRKLENTKYTFKYDDFIEYNDNLQVSDIEKIEYSTSYCYGTCPVYKVLINKNKSANLNAIDYNESDKKTKELKGNYSTNIDFKKYNQIIDILNYIDFKNLKDKYFYNATDQPTGILTVTYENGKTKSIEDYGKKGTNGLFILYNLFDELRFNQDWKELKL